MSRITRDLANAPLPQMVENLGKGIAEAQYAMDHNALRIAQQMAGFKENDNGELVADENALIQMEQGKPKVSLLSLGFTPTFYQFAETHMEIKVSFSMSESREISMSASVGVRAWMVTASVSASYSQKYQYSAEGSSSIRTKLVSVPSPAIFEQRLKQLSKSNSSTSD